jgi:hypothetical protein
MPGLLQTADGKFYRKPCGAVSLPPPPLAMSEMKVPLYLNDYNPSNALNREYLEHMHAVLLEQKAVGEDTALRIDDILQHIQDKGVYVSYMIAGTDLVSGLEKPCHVSRLLRKDPRVVTIGLDRDTFRYYLHEEPRILPSTRTESRYAFARDPSPEPLIPSGLV